MHAHRWAATCLTLTLLSALVPARAAAQASISGVALLPSAPTTLDRVQITINGNGCIAFNQPPDVSSMAIRIDATLPPCPPGAPPSAWTQRFVVGPLAAGTYTLTVYLDQTLGWSSQFTVIVGTRDTELFLNQGRFKVDVTLHDPRAGGPGYSRAFSDESGYFWFFDPANVELTVKILDGRPLNGHFWVFVASMTDVGFTLVVNDTSTQVERTYVSQPSRNQNFIDVAAF